MLVKYVWPFRQLPESQERKTFFWLECNYEEAIDVLHQAKLSVEDFRKYVDLLQRFREENHADRDLGEGLDVYSRIGFLISEDGKNVEWAPSGFPISSLWNADNPFEEITPLHLEIYKDFVQMADQFAQQNPEFSSQLTLPPELGQVCPDRPSRDAQQASDEWSIEQGDGQAS